MTQSTSSGKMVDDPIPLLWKSHLRFRSAELRLVLQIRDGTEQSPFETGGAGFWWVSGWRFGDVISEGLPRPNIAPLLVTFIGIRQIGSACGFRAACLPS